ncbi:hypothetical protein QEN19_001777 [Hanseniaspora menglaensis]
MSKLSASEFTDRIIEFYLKRISIHQSELDLLQSRKEEIDEARTIRNEKDKLTEKKILKNAIYNKPNKKDKILQTKKIRLLLPESLPVDLNNILFDINRLNLKNEKSALSKSYKKQAKTLDYIKFATKEKHSNTFTYQNPIIKDTFDLQQPPNDYFLLPVVDVKGNLKHLCLSFSPANNKFGISNFENILTPFQDLYFLYYQSQRASNSYVIVQFETKTTRLTHDYILSNRNPFDSILSSSYNCKFFNLIKIDKKIIPLKQLPSWKILTLYYNQENPRYLSLINFENFLVLNDIIKIKLQLGKTLTFDLNSGVLNISNQQTCMHRSDFKHIEYNSLSPVLLFKMISTEDILICTESNFDASETVQKINNWENFRKQSPILYMFEEIPSQNSILFAGKVKFDKIKDCMLILYYNRFEVYREQSKHLIRSYLNKKLDLKYKLCFYTFWKNICLPPQYLQRSETTEWILISISYFKTNNLEVVNAPKVLKFGCESVSEKEKWLEYISYLKIVVE